MPVVAASFFPTGAASDLITAITTALSDNVGVVLAVLGFTVGLKYVIRWFNHSLRGRI
jgi:hypothetical protein